MTPSESLIKDLGNARRERSVKLSREHMKQFALNPVENSHLLATVTIEHKYPRLSDILVANIKECSHNIKGFFFQTSNLDETKQE